MSALAALSVIIPSLNEAATLVATLARLQAARARGVEIIVVDGGSGDGTIALAADWVDRVLTAERGRAAQMNAGARAAQGERLLFLHADTCLPDNFDQTITSALPVSQPAWGRFDVHIEGAHPMLRVIAWMMNQRSRLTGIATGDQGIFMTRAAFEAVQGFPQQNLMEDIEISKRLKRLARPVCLRQRVSTSGRRWEKNGIGKTIFLMWRLRLLYFFGVSPRHLNDLYHGR